MSSTIVKVSKKQLQLPTQSEAVPPPGLEELARFGLALLSYIVAHDPGSSAADEFYNDWNDRLQAVLRSPQ